MIASKLFGFRRYLSRMLPGAKFLKDEQAVKAIVRCVEGDDRLRISLKYKKPGSESVKYFNFERLKSEPLNATLARITNNLLKVDSSKKGKQKSDAVDVPVAQPVLKVVKSGNELDSENILNEEAWTTADEFVIDSTRYPIVVNYPTVILLQVCDSPFANFPLPAKCTMEFAERKNSVFEWFVSCEPSEADLTSVLHRNWKKVSEGFYFEPSEDMIGKHILLKCTPVSDSVQGEPVLSQTNNPVRHGPKNCPFEIRQQEKLPLRKPENLRITTYNVLAEVYSDMSTTFENLFPYCPKEFLTYSYRRKLLMKEIPGYDSDIYCLQEIDKHAFQNDYEPMMLAKGYGGFLTLKTREVRYALVFFLSQVFNTIFFLSREGLAFFYRLDRFELLGQYEISIRGLLDDPGFALLNEKLSHVPHIREHFATRSSVLQIALVLDKNESKPLLICNTHLYFEWNADNIRLLQAYACCQVISRIKRTIEKERGESVPVLFCGDFNSDYRCGVLRLLTNGKLPPNFNEFYQGGLKNFIPGLNDVIKTDVKFFPASGTPIYTTFVSAFQACLDYIYAEKDEFETVFKLPIYEEEDFIHLTALPNEFFGSDHMAMVVDLKYKK